MKKSIILIAAAALLSMTACQKENIVPGNNVTPSNNVTPGNGGNSTAMVKTTADLIGTEWTYTMDSLVAVDAFGDTISIPSLGDLFYLNFDADYAHFSFSDMIEAWGMSADGMTMEQISGVDYEYSYNGTTHTGSLNGTIEDENGTEVATSLTFTYDDLTDEITFIIPMAFDGDTTEIDVPMVFHRAI